MGGRSPPRESPRPVPTTAPGKSIRGDQHGFQREDNGLLLANLLEALGDTVNTCFAEAQDLELYRVTRHRRDQISEYPSIGIRASFFAMTLQIVVKPAFETGPELGL